MRANIGLLPFHYSGEREIAEKASPIFYRFKKEINNPQSTATRVNGLGEYLAGSGSKEEKGLLPNENLDDFNFRRLMRKSGLVMLPLLYSNNDPYLQESSSSLPGLLNLKKNVSSHTVFSADNKYQPDTDNKDIPILLACLQSLTIEEQKEILTLANGYSAAAVDAFYITTQQPALNDPSGGGFSNNMYNLLELTQLYFARKGFSPKFQALFYKEAQDLFFLSVEQVLRFQQRQKPQATTAKKK